MTTTTGTLVHITGIHAVPDPIPVITPPVPLVAVESLLAELLAARQVIANVRDHHRMVGSATGSPWCVQDGRQWPCPTTRALDGDALIPNDAA